MSLRTKLIFLFLAVALIPLFFVSVLTFHNYKTSLETTLLSNLQDIAAFKADRTETFFAGLKGSLETARSFYNIKKNLPILITYAGDPNHPEFIAAKQALDEQLQHVQSILQLMDIMLVNPDGKVVYSSDSRHYPLDFLHPLSDPAQTAFEEGKTKLFLSDIFLHKKDGNKPTILITAPAVNLDGIFIGVIAFEVDTTAMYKIIQDVTGLGKTGEVLAGKKEGNQVVFLSPLKFDPNAALTRTADIGGQLALPMQQAVGGKTGAGLLIDYRGQDVIAAWRHIPSLNWGLVAKIDTEEAYAEVTKLRNLAIIILAIVTVLSSITAFSIARSIAEPIKRLSEGAAIIGSGNLDYKIGTHLKDEVGQLSRSFDKMTLDLKQTLASRDELNREVRERKQAEEALQQANERYELVFAGAEAGIWDWDVPRHKVVFSQQWKAMRGFAPEEIGDSEEEWSQLIHPEDSPRVMAAMQAHFEGQTAVFAEEYRVRCKDGSWMWIADQGLAQRNSHGHVVRMAGSETDITERKLVEDTLKFLVQCGGPASGEDFFNSLARYLGQSLNMDFVCIDRLEENLLTAKTLAVYFDGKFEDNITYTLKDTPCGQVAGKTICSFAKDVHRLFPHDEVLANMEAESYIGTTLWSSQGQPIGLIALIGRKPLKNTKLAESILQLTAVRAAGELERREAEEAMAAARIAAINDKNRLETVLETLPVGVAILDAKGGNLRANDTFEKICGGPRPPARDVSDYVAYKAWWADTGQPVKPEEWASARAVQQRETIIGQVMEIERFDGSHAFIMNSAAPIFDASGKISGSVVTLHDITERKRAEKALHESEQRLQMALQLSRSFAFEWEPVTDRVLRSDSCAFILGLSGDEALQDTGQNYFQRVHSLDREQFVEMLGKLQPTEDTYHTEYRLLRPDGSMIILEESGQAFFDPDGKLSRVIGFTIDITERKRAEEALRQSNEELNRFNRAAVGRELRMIKLKKEVNVLCRLAGKQPQYALEFEKESET